MTQAREPDTGAVPECPFPLNSVVTCGDSAPLTVIGWYVQSGTQARYVQVRYPDGEISGVEPDRLVTYVPPPEPPLRVGDFARGRNTGKEGQIVTINDVRTIRLSTGSFGDERNYTRIEPPVGWPVGVPTIDAPTVWYFKSTSSGKYVWCGDVEIDFSWADLLAAGGVPALAVTR
jgi:hypothetical protein